MNIWKILGVAPTTDQKSIKAAFAAKSREWHPEEYPEEYQRLRQAYKLALAYAQNENGEPAPASDNVQTDITAKDPDRLPDFTYAEVDDLAILDLESDFLQDFDLLSGNPYLINRLSCWRCFLSRHEYAALWENNGFRRRFMENIAARHGWLPKTLKFFEFWLSASKKENSGKAFSAAWKFALLRSRLPRPEAQNRTTPQEKAEHAGIMAKLKAKDVNASLENDHTMAAYLEYFLPYARAHAERIQALQSRGRTYREQISVFIASMVIACCILGLVSVSFYMQESAVQKSSVSEQLPSAEGPSSSGTGSNDPQTDAGQEAHDAYILEITGQQRLDQIQSFYEELTEELTGK